MMRARMVRLHVFRARRPQAEAMLRPFFFDALSKRDVGAAEPLRNLLMAWLYGTFDHLQQRALQEMALCSLLSLPHQLIWTRAIAAVNQTRCKLKGAHPRR